MTENQTVGKIVYAIKNRRQEVVDFLIKYGQPVKKSDSDVQIGKYLSSTLSSNRSAIDDFAKLLAANPSSFDPITLTALAGSLGNIFTKGKEQQIAEQQGSDAITLALINAGTQKKETNWVLIAGVVTLGIVLIIIGILLYRKYSKK